MAFSYVQACGNRECGQLHTIYVDEDEVPAMGEVFTYVCPKCKQQIASYPQAVTVDVAIPADAVIATRPPSENSA